jgi:plasmid stabilization system protein ParE
MKVYWAQNAIEHLVNIYEYIALNSPACAKRMVDKITRRSEQIVQPSLWKLARDSTRDGLPPTSRPSRIPSAPRGSQNSEGGQERILNRL